MQKFGSFFFFILVLAVGNFGYGQARTSLKKSKSKKQKRVLHLGQEDVLDKNKKFGLNVSYDISYDSLETTEEKTLGHEYSLLATYSINQHWTLMSSFGASHQSSGGQVYRENDSDKFHSLSNFGLGISDRVKLDTYFLSAITNSLFVSLPTSERSRIDQHRFSLNFNNNIRSQAWKGLSFSNRFGVNYLSHRLKFSFYNSDKMNRDWLVRNRVGFTFQAFSHLAFSAGVRLSAINYLDDTWDSSVGNNFTVLTHIAGVQLYASLINNSYAEERYYEADFFDKYRRVIVGGASYAF